ncbi:sigma-54-dependent transcriptional regulator [Leyella lascolaii]|uniref:Sigma-54 dependent transcriptional regulator n=1 Tax=Leyella lascolaii TaxID=1776379 RepID=A0AAW7JFC1_9BACT|nr:sigma-54 dependent transcriptional regulator [Leyella lascolaii]MDN0022033.1 sigma-54 dependent transcriptional regulator [Leyella lascolaii]MDN0024574.1 sigma-54 dependent transcriptional regulator [Leyella lascolaii]
MASILIVEDDITFATMIGSWLRRKGFDAEKVSSVAAAKSRLQDSAGAFDLILSDLRLPDHDGLVLLEWMRHSGMDTPFIVMTIYAEVQNAVLAMKSGAADYIAKPPQPDILLQKINDALSMSHRAAKPVAEDTPARKASQTVPRHIEGNDRASRQLYEYISLVAPTPMSVLILGASGTGKEYAARRIHELSRRAGKRFLAIDCGAIPKDVAASEFFGHVKGAYTGAVTDKKGAFEEADGGTLFLDEVGNLAYDVQVQLLRALQERRVRPLGSTKEIEVDIRLICATNENLAGRVADGGFREDLYHRISEFTIRMPELKERGNDLFLFADLFVKQADEELGRNVLGFDDKASEMLARYDWPGNLRELNNVVKRATLLTRGQYIGVDELSRALGPVSEGNMALHDENDELQRIKAALRATGGNKSKTARLLSIDRKTLYNKMQKYGLPL